VPESERAVMFEYIAFNAIKINDKNLMIYYCNSDLALKVVKENANVISLVNIYRSDVFCFLCFTVFAPEFLVSLKY
jgi:hypothetical protein